MVLLRPGDLDCDPVSDWDVFCVYLWGKFELDEVILVRFDSAQRPGKKSY